MIVEVIGKLRFVDDAIDFDEVARSVVRRAGNVDEDEDGSPAGKGTAGIYGMSDLNCWLADNLLVGSQRDNQACRTSKRQPRQDFSQAD